MEPPKFRLGYFKNYFKNKENILVFSLLLIFLILGFIIRIGNLSYLAFWGDDGATFVSTEGILKYGYPRLPSGNIMFHNILTYYINAFFALIFGLNEFSFRLVSILSSLVVVVVTYFLGKELVNRYVGLFSAFAVTFLSWMIEFSRHARYYSQFQAFFIASILFFYLGYFKEIKKFKILAIFFLALIGLVHGVGIFLMVIFIPLLIYKKRRFFKKDIILGFIIVLASNLIQIVNQTFFWRVGRSFYPESYDFLTIMRTYLKFPELRYFRIFRGMYPDISFIVYWGVILFILAGIVFTKKDEIFGKFNYIGWNRFKLYENGFFLYFLFFLNIVILELGRMVDQPRYVYNLLPLFIIIYVYILFILSYMIYKFIIFLIEKISAHRKAGKVKLKKYFPRTAVVSVLLGIFMIFSINGINIAEAVDIPKREYGEKLNPFYSFSTTRDFHSDSKTPALYVKENMEENDIIITMDLYNSYPYTEKIDYWLWTGTLTYWQPYHEIGGLLYDDVFKSIVIRSLMQMLEILDEHKDKNIWILTTPSIDIRVHIHPSIADFLKSREDNLVYAGKDDISSVYLFEKDPTRERFGISYVVPPEKENTIDLTGVDSYYLDFTYEDTAKYYIFGWSTPEPGGTWAMSEKSYLYLKLSGDISYRMIIDAKPLYDPDEPLVVDISLNGEKIETLVYSKNEFIEDEIVIGRSFLGDEDDIYELEFSYSYNKRPIDVGIMHDDPRYLSLMVKNIYIEKIEQ